MSLDAKRANQLGENLGFLGSVEQSKNNIGELKLTTHTKHINTDQFWRLVSEIKDAKPVDISMKRSGTGITITLS